MVASSAASSLVSSASVSFLEDTDTPSTDCLYLHSSALLGCLGDVSEEHFTCIFPPYRGVCLYEAYFVVLRLNVLHLFHESPRRSTRDINAPDKWICYF